MKTATFFALLFAMMTVAWAQSPTPNLALTATASHIGGGATTYGAQNYNDGIITASGAGCGTALTPWGWTSAPVGWINFAWTVPQTVGEITFYYAQTCSRYLQSGQIQYWNGSSFVTWYSFSFPDNTTWVRSIQFPPVTTTQIRIHMPAGSVTGTQASNPNFREIEIRNVCTDPETQVSFSVPPSIEKPNSVSIQYSIFRPIGTFNATLTFKFFTPQNVLVYSESTTVPYTGVPVNGVYSILSSNLPTGFYRLEVTFNVMGICNKLEDVVRNQVIMIINAGMTPCIVYPGDVNNDGFVNYGDRSALNRYIFDANLRPLWLNGPARYRADVATNPMTFFAWEPQPSIPWATQDGCYMDADGNGVINNFDYLAIKLNWMKSHVTTPKASVKSSFELMEVYPNPFNPTTTIHYVLTEDSDVRLEVLYLDGRTISVVDRGIRVAGEYRLPFDGVQLSSGTYLVVLTARGQNSGEIFSKSVKIVLSK